MAVTGAWAWSAVGSMCADASMCASTSSQVLHDYEVPGILFLFLFFSDFSSLLFVCTLISGLFY